MAIHNIVSPFSSYTSNTYHENLSVLIQTDPHPGNLLRTKDGKLCILDFGMTLETPPDLQYSLLEFIAHLTAEDYEQVPYDFVKLDFLKEEKVDLLVKTGALEPLYYFLRQANQGGGGTKVRERIFDGESRLRYVLLLLSSSLCLLLYINI